MSEPMPDLLATLRRNVESNPRAPFVDGSAGCDRIAFLRQVAGAYENLRGLVGPIGLLIDDGRLWMAALITLEAKGQTVVPLPHFFSDSQLEHAMTDAGICVVVADEASAARAEALGFPFTVLRPSESDPGFLPLVTSANARQIIYTSGSTGHPKGVVHASSAITSKAASLIEATGAKASDRVLSVLPLSLLLEQVVAVRATILAGASVTLAQDAYAAALGGNLPAFAAVIERVNPTTTVMVPELLKAWIGGLRMTGRRAPDGLRFVAVGGASVAPALADAAWAFGIPAYEGYGLTECGSVVAVNRPGDRRSGTVGRPLADCRIAIEDGEVVVSGPGVMIGYAGGQPVGGTWRTGDLGSLSDDGRLTIHGRRDSLLVLSTGRNVSPDWIEGLIAADPRFARCLVIGQDQPHTTAIVEVMPNVVLTQAELVASVARLTNDAPTYARPSTVTAVSLGTFFRHGLLTPNGRIRRKAAAAVFSATPASSILAKVG